MPDQPEITVGTVTTSFPLTPGDVSGIFVYRLLQHLPKTIRTLVITPASRAREVRRLAEDRIELVAVRYAPRSWQRLAHGGGGIPAALSHHRWLYLLLPALLLAVLVACVWKARRVDLFHAHWSINGLISGLAGKLTGTPVVTTLRGSDVNLAANSAFYRALLKLCARFSSKVVVVDGSLRTTLQKLLPGLPVHKISVVENGIDERYFRIERRSPMAGSVVTLITVGNLTANKGVELILRAMSDLGRNCRLRIVGGGPERQHLVELAASLGLEDRVEFTGPVPPREIPSYLAAAEVFVLASYSEGRPNAMLEAMASGLPVIASDIPGTRCLVTSGVNGLLFPPGSASRLAERLVEITENAALRERLGMAARQSVAARGLRWSEAASRYENLYRKLLAGRITG